MASGAKKVHVIVGAWSIGASKGTMARTACGMGLVMLTRWCRMEDGVYGGPIDVKEVAETLPSGRLLCSHCARTDRGVH